MTTVNWLRDPEIEQRLTASGMKFKFHKDYPLNKVDFELSKHNNARLTEPLNEDTVEEYWGAMERGDRFPPVAVYAPTGTLIAGVHRVGALKLLDVNVVDAYVVTESDPLELEKFIRTDNGRNGLNVSDEDKIEQAVYLHMVKGMTIIDACDEMWGGRRDMYPIVNARVHRAIVRNTLLSLGESAAKVELVAKRNPGALGELYQLAPKKTGGGMGNSKLIAKAFRVVADACLGTVDTKTMVLKVKEAGNEAAGLEVIKSYGEFVKTGAAMRMSTDGAQFKHGLTRLHKLLCERPSGAGPIESFGDMGIKDPDDCRALMTSMKEVISAFHSIQTTYKKGKK